MVLFGRGSRRWSVLPCLARLPRRLNSPSTGGGLPLDLRVGHVAGVSAPARDGWTQGLERSPPILIRRFHPHPHPRPSHTLQACACVCVRAPAAGRSRRARSAERDGDALDRYGLLQVRRRARARAARRRAGDERASAGCDRRGITLHARMRTCMPHAAHPPDRPSDALTCRTAGSRAGVA